MYSRTWHGAVPLEYKDGFLKYEYETGVKDTKKTSGNKGAFLKLVERGDYAHFFLCTFWESMESMILYAGKNPEIAVDYPEDKNYKLISDPIVVIQKVVSNENPFK